MARIAKRKSVATQTRRSKKRRIATKSRARSVKYVRGFQRKVKKTLMNLSETKEVLIEVCTNQSCKHNALTNLSANALSSTQGWKREQEGYTPAGNIGARIGDTIFVKGFSVALHIEGQQYRPRTHFKLFLVRNRTVDTTIDSKNQMYEGVNTNIMLDWLDTSKCEIIWSKNFIVTMPNQGTSVTANTGTEGLPPGTFDLVSGGETYTLVTNPSWRGKFYVPINKNIRYQENSTIPAFSRYQWVMQAYDNYTMPSSGAYWDAYPVGHVSMCTKMKFKDV